MVGGEPSATSGLPNFLVFSSFRSDLDSFFRCFLDSDSLADFSVVVDSFYFPSVLAYSLCSNWFYIPQSGNFWKHSLHMSLMHCISIQNFLKELNPTAYYGLGLVAMAFIGWAAQLGWCESSLVKTRWSQHFTAPMSRSGYPGLGAWATSNEVNRKTPVILVSFFGLHRICLPLERV